MALSAIRLERERELGRESRGIALTPAATALIAAGAATMAAWLWSRVTQPDIDAATRARLQRQPLQPGA